MCVIPTKCVPWTLERVILPHPRTTVFCKYLSNVPLLGAVLGMLCGLLRAYLFDENKTAPNMGVHGVALDVLFPLVLLPNLTICWVFCSFQPVLTTSGRFLGRFWGPDRP